MGGQLLRRTLFSHSKVYVLFGYYQNFLYLFPLFEVFIFWFNVDRVLVLLKRHHSHIRMKFYHLLSYVFFSPPRVKRSEM